MSKNVVRLAVFICMTIVCVGFSDFMEAATFKVSKTADTNDGTCSADCSLREAFVAVDAAAGTDSIEIPPGVYVLSLGQLTLNSTVKIQGGGEAITVVDGGGNSRILSIGASGSVAIADMTFQNGEAPAGEFGGAILNAGVLTLSRCRVTGNSGAVAGGGVRTEGTLTLNGTTISDNFAANGGGISNSAVLTVSNSTISGNLASISGGGINSSGSPTTLTNTTIYGNTASANVGGGFRVFAGTVTMNNVTITGNVSGVSGGGISNNGTVNVQNTIVAGNLGPSSPDCGGTPLASQGHNLIGDASCALSGDLTGNLVGVAPKLDPLNRNGGRTLTTALLASGPAIDAGNDSTCAATDQRSVVRPQFGACDIGAFEFSCRAWQRREFPNTLPDDIAIIPGNNSILYAAVGGSAIGILKSTDGGESWTTSNTGLFDLLIRSVAVDPVNPSNVYAGSQGAPAMYKSTNAGASWDQSDAGINGFPFDIAIDPLNPAVIYASSAALGVNKSTDGGASWNLLNNGITGSVFKVAVHPGITSTVYAATNQGFFITTNGGANWSASNFGLADLNLKALALDPSDPKRLYVGTSSTGVSVSMNGGNLWGTALNGPSGSIESLTVDPLSGIVYAGTTTQGVFRSNDGGLSWTKQNTGLLGVSGLSNAQRVTALAVGTNGVLHAGVNHGLFTFNHPTLACDDFEDQDADDWTFTKGTWNVLSGNLRGTFTKKADNISPLPPCSNCVFEGDVTIDSPAARASLLGWYADKQNHVEIVLMEDKDKILLKHRAGGTTVTKGKATMPLVVGQTYHVRVEFDGSQFLVAVDGAPAFGVSTSTTPSGGLGVRVKSTTGTNATVSFGEFVVYSLL